MPNRLIAYIDGFNLYHAIDDLKDNRLKWLNLRKLAESLCGDGEEVSAVYYFTAYATWKKEAYKRHRDYIRALTAQGVTPVIGNFKEKRSSCNSCRVQWTRHEEKETDVHIAVQIIHDAHLQNYDHAISLGPRFDIRRARIQNCQFPDRVLAPDGSLLVGRPIKYRNP